MDKTKSLAINKKKISPLKICLLILALTGMYYYYVYEISDNFKPVIANKIYRSAQPDCQKLAEWIDEYNLKTVVNLRGPTAEFAEAETEICNMRNVIIFHVKMNAYKKIPSNILIEMVDTIDQIETPVLLHCRQGVDRSGTASSLTSWLLGMEPYEKAKNHSFVLPGPWKYKNGFNHISDIFKDYENYCSKNDLEPDNQTQFKDWARNIYHPDYFYVSYQTSGVVSVTPGSVADLDITVINLSEMTIPAGKRSRKFRVTSRLIQEDQVLEPRKQYFETTLIEAKNLKPGENTSLTHKLTAPQEPGIYKFVLDMQEKDDHSFARQGSPVFEGILLVGIEKHVALSSEDAIKAN